MTCPTPTFRDGIANTCVGKLFETKCWAYCIAGYNGQPREYECMLNNVGDGVEIKPHGEEVVCEGTSRRLRNSSAMPRRLSGTCMNAKLIAEIANSISMTTSCNTTAQGENCIVE